MATLELMHSPTPLDYRFPGGLNRLPGYTVGTDWTSPLLNLADAAKAAAGTIPRLPFLGMVGLLPAGLLKFLVARDPGFDVPGFDPPRPGPLRTRLLEVSDVLDRVDADIGRFMERGGRLILVHGRSDELVPEEETVRFYRNAVRRHGQEAVDRAVAFYLVPGLGHGLGVGFRASRMPLPPGRRRSWSGRRATRTGPRCSACRSSRAGWPTAGRTSGSSTRSGKSAESQYVENLFHASSDPGGRQWHSFWRSRRRFFPSLS